MSKKKTLFPQPPEPVSKTIIIIGRGHSGSRAISELLTKNNFYPGKINVSYDKRPFAHLNNVAKKMMQRYYSNNHDNVLSKIKPIETADSIEYIREYMQDLLISSKPLKLAKNASLTFIYELLTKQFPDYYYLYWTRSISKKNEHRRGDAGDTMLSKWNFNVTNVESAWKVYYDIVRLTPKPKHFMHIRFEDLILDQESVIRRLEDWLCINLPNRIHCDHSKVFPNDHNNLSYDYLIEPMKDLGYIS